jgi:hypothetical protein
MDNNEDFLTVITTTEIINFSTSKPLNKRRVSFPLHLYHNLECVGEASVFPKREACTDAPPPYMTA